MRASVALILLGVLTRALPLFAAAPQAATEALTGSIAAATASRANGSSSSTNAYSSPHSSAASRAATLIPQTALLEQLQRAGRAARETSYTGIFVYQQGADLRSTRIAHLFDGRNEQEKLEMLDGQRRQFIRSNQILHNYIPDTRTILVEQRGAQESFPALFSQAHVALLENYELSQLDAARIAGQEALGIRLQARDKLRYSYAAWTDSKTGLLLRLQTLGPRGELLEQFSFAELKLAAPARSQFEPGLGNLSNWHRETSAILLQEVPGLQAHGLPAGFKRIGQARRKLGEAGPQGSTREVLQLLYSDQLAFVSVFIEPWQAGKKEGLMQQGPTHLLTKRQGDFWLTIVGEVPASAVREFAAALTYQPVK